MFAHRRLISALLGFAVVASAAGFVPVAGAGGAAKARRAFSDEVADDARTGRLTVGYKGSARSVRAVVRAKGGSVAHSAASVDVIVARPPAGTSVDAFARRLVHQPGVAYAEPEVRMSATAIPNDTHFSLQWGLGSAHGLRMPTAWDTTTGSPSAVVAVLDTGLRSSHVDAPVTIVAEKDLVDDDDVANDPAGHGTHVAGTVAGATGNATGVAGVAPQVGIMPVRVLDANGSGSDVMAAEGIVYAADQGADVINMSFGGTESSTVLENAVAYARTKGCVIVAAAGNGASSAGYVPDTLLYPAALPGVISVGAVGTYSPFSPFPEMTSYTARSTFSQYGWGLDVVAPGARILSLGSSADDSYVVADGTSMATPHVSGLAALLRSVHTTWTADQIETAMKRSAQDLGAAGFDRFYGNGMVRADSALSLNASPVPPPEDDDIPGTPATKNPVSGVVEWQGDPDDVYSVEATAGETIELSISSSANDLDLLLFGPGATTVLDQTVAKAKSNFAGTSSERLSYKIPPGQGGTYYVDVYAYDGGGPYTLYWAEGIKTHLTIGGYSKVTLGQRASLGGRFTADTGEFLSGRTVMVEALPSGSAAWRKVATTTTGPTGLWAAGVLPDRTTQYRARSAWKSGFLTAQTPPRTVTAYSYLSRPKAPESVKPGDGFTTSGFMSPRHASGAKTVQVRCYRRESGRWKLRKTVYATNRYYSATKTKYRARLSLPTRGKWKLVARVKADSRHATTYSLPRVVMVR